MKEVLYEEAHVARNCGLTLASISRKLRLPLGGLQGTESQQPHELRRGYFPSQTSDEIRAPGGSLDGSLVRHAEAEDPAKLWPDS